MASADRQPYPQSHTTLSCGVVSAAEGTLKFDFFAIGDSPIWKVVSNRSEELDFQGFVVYSGPFPGEQEQVYSTLNLKGGSIDGAVYFGSVDIGPREVLVLVSDGIPDVRFFWDDQDPKRNKASPKIGLRLLDPAPLDDETLARLVVAYDQNYLLIDDDASLVVVRAVSEPPALQSVPARDPTGGASESAMEQYTVTDSSDNHLPADTLELSSLVRPEDADRPGPVASQEQSYALAEVIRASKEIVDARHTTAEQTVDAKVNHESSSSPVSGSTTTAALSPERLENKADQGEGS